MDLFLKGVYERKKETQRLTRRICFTLAKVMGSEVNKESDIWIIDEEENSVDVSYEKIDYFKKKLIELGKWKN